MLLPDRAGVSQHGFPDGVPVTVVRYSQRAQRTLNDAESQHT